MRDVDVKVLVADYLEEDDLTVVLQARELDGAFPSKISGRRSTSY
jgi:hypothetical protein